MRKWFFAGLMLCSFTHAKAQSFNLSDKGCATVTTSQEMQDLAAYIANPHVKAKTTAGVDSIPLSIHIVSKTDGSGRYRLDHLLTVLCQLNTRYKPVGFYFYVKWPVHFIKNTSYYVHDHWNGSQMMSQNNVPNTTNVYFVNDPAGACGYYTYGEDAVAISNNCSAPNSTTLTHEIGHYFGLPHTFSGWENGQTPANPEKVTRGPGANCSTAGDMFCDTEADYLGARWNCPYSGTKVDQNGQKYHPDSSLYMAYSDDACMTRFSNQQIGRMQNRLATGRTYLLNANSPTGSATIDTNINILYPKGTVYSNLRSVWWNKVSGAQAYYVKVGLSLGTMILQDTITADTSITLNISMVNNGLYSVTVVPLSDVNVCMDAQKRVVFSYTDATTSVTNVAGATNALTLYPNPANQTVTLKLDAAAGNYTLQVSNISGQKVMEQMITHQGGSSSVAFPVNQLPNGLYLVKLSGSREVWTEKLVVQH